MLEDSNPLAMSTQYTDGMAQWKKSLNPSYNPACTGTTTLRVDFLKIARKKPQTSGPIIMKVTTVQQWSIVEDTVSSQVAPQLQHLQCFSNLARGNASLSSQGALWGIHKNKKHTVSFHSQLCLCPLITKSIKSSKVLPWNNSSIFLGSFPRKNI